jgi:redox-sensing transcriptional repressor
MSIYRFRESDGMDRKTLTTQMIRRLPLYLNYLKVLPKERSSNISATTIAHELHLNDVQVRKDLALVSGNGRPKIGYFVNELIQELEHCLGYDNVESAVLVGDGSLGRALLAYEGFVEYGVEIVAAFASDESIADTSCYDKRILPMNKLPYFCTRMKIKIGIIAVDSLDAQKACNMLVECGVMAIWNFVPVHLKVPEHVMVKDENLASSLAILSNHLALRIR